MSERSILAYFNSPEQAEGVASKLKAMRVDTIQIDRISRFPTQSSMGVDHLLNPLTGDPDSQAELLLNARFDTRGAAILADASPAVYSMGNVGADMIDGHDILLTAVVDEAVYEQAVRVCEQNGALI